MTTPLRTIDRARALHPAIEAYLKAHPVGARRVDLLRDLAKEIAAARAPDQQWPPAAYLLDKSLQDLRTRGLVEYKRGRWLPKSRTEVCPTCRRPLVG